MSSAIYEGTVSHSRLWPQRHYFQYSLYMMYLDLAELPALFDPYPGYSARVPALAWFRRADHAGDARASLAETIQALIYKQTGATHTGAIHLLTHLRYFFCCMNPVSFYYCWDASGARVDFIVAEVHNTPWNETHCYVLDNRDNGDNGSRDAHVFDFAKRFHVSPFMPMQQHYQWTLALPGEHLQVHMSSYEDDKKIFKADMRLERRTISQYQMARVLLAYPAITAKVLTAIYWQALRLWAKRIPFCPHPKHARKQTVAGSE